MYIVRQVSMMLVKRTIGNCKEIYIRGAINAMVYRHDTVLDAAQ